MVGDRRRFTLGADVRGVTTIVAAGLVVGGAAAVVAGAVVLVLRIAGAAP